MKILKYIIFLSILSSLFLQVYHQSNNTGFRRWWMSFKTAAFIAAILAGLIPNPNFVEEIEPHVSNNVPSIEKIFSNQEFNSLEKNGRQVILVGRDSSGTPSPSNIGRQGQSPSDFPTPPSGARPSRNVPGVNPYRATPRVVDQGLGAAANPAGAGGGGGAPEFDDQCPVSKEQKSQESKVSEYDYRSNAPKKKKQSAEQCELDENVKDAKIEIVYKIKENPALVREAERMGKDQAAQKDVNHLIEQLSLGNKNPGIGTQRVKGLKNVSEARARNEGRVYFREKDGKIEILAKSNKDNQNKVIDILQELGY